MKLENLTTQTDTLVRHRDTKDRRSEATAAAPAPQHIIIGDCLEQMRTMPDGSVDAIVTSPPYNLNIKYRSYDDRRGRDVTSTGWRCLSSKWRVFWPPVEA